MGQVRPIRIPPWVWGVGPWQMPPCWNCGSRGLGCEKAVQAEDQDQPQGEAQTGSAEGCRVLLSPGLWARSLQFCLQSCKLSDPLPSHWAASVPSLAQKAL